MVDAIFEETNGNAFFVQSVYQHLADEGRLLGGAGPDGGLAADGWRQRRLARGLGASP